MKNNIKRFLSLFSILTLLLNMNLVPLADEIRPEIQTTQETVTESVSTETEIAEENTVEELTEETTEESEVSTANVSTASTTPSVSSTDKFMPTDNNSGVSINPAEYESVSILNGSMNFNYPIVGLNGKAGLNINLALSYNSFDATHDEVGVIGSPQKQKDEGIALGWSFSAPRVHKEGTQSVITMPDGQTVIHNAGEDYFRNNYYEIIYVKDKSPDLNDYRYALDGVDYTNGRYLDLSDVPNMAEDFEEYSIVYSDRYENTITYTYDSENRLINITDTLGREISIVYDQPVSENLDKRNILIKVDDVTVYTIEIEKKITNDTGTSKIKSTYWILNSLTDSSGDKLSFEYLQKQQHKYVYYDDVEKWGHILSECLTDITYPTGGTSKYTYETNNTIYCYANKVTGGYVQYELYPVKSNTVDGSEGVKEYTYTYDGRLTKSFNNNSNIILHNAGVWVSSNNYIVAIYEEINAYGEIGLIRKIISTSEEIKTKYLYNSLHQLEQVTTYVKTAEESTKTVETWTYDYEPRGTFSYNNLESHTDIYGNTTTYNYDFHYNIPINQVTTSVDGKTITVTNKLTDDNKGIEKSTTVTSDGIETVTEYDYDNYGQVENTTYSETGKGQVVTINTYDYLMSALPKTVTIKNVKTNNQNFVNQIYDKVTTYTYDNFDRVLTESVYASNDSSNKMTTAYEYYADGSVEQVIAPNGDITHYTYNIKCRDEDCEENSTVIKYIFKNPVDGVQDYTKKEIYDDFGLILEKQKEIGANNFKTYETYVYLDGNIDHTIDEYGLITEYEYDRIDRVTKVINPDETVKETQYNDAAMTVVTIDEEGNPFTTVYDKYGRVVNEIAPNGSTTVYEYDWMGNVKKVTDPLGGVTTNVYDGLGRLTSVTNAENEVTTYQHDLLNNVSKMITNGNSVFEYRYDILNNLIEQTDALGKTEKFAYDVFGRLTNSVDKNGAISTVEYVDKTALPLNTTKTKAGEVTQGTVFTYNSFGNVDEKTDVATGKITKYGYTYDQKPASVTEKDSENDVGKTLTYDYYDNAQLESVTDYFQNTTIYQYNDRGFVETILKDDVPVVQYEYYDHGLLKKETRGGIISDYTYTNVGLLHTLTNTTVDNSFINSYTYEYDAAGNQTQKTETKGDASIVESYTYDDVGRLESITAGNELTEYLYDANGNRSTQTVTTDGVQNLVIEYDYDLQNRLTEQISQKNGETEHKKYAYDNNGNLYSEMTSVVKNTAGLTEHSIAKTGDVAQFPAVKLYKYNLNGQLISYEDDNGIKATYTYNPDGMRSTKTVNGETTRYYYNGMYAVNEEQNGELTATNILGANGIIGRTAQGSTGYFVKNGHGDVIQARTTDGTILGNYDYDPWGNSTLADGTWDNPIRYAGEYTDDESGLIYLRARYYDSSIGRFISEDPIRDGLNWYAYCANNPVAFVDPSGLVVTIWDEWFCSKEELKQLNKNTKIWETGNETEKKDAAESSRNIRLKYLPENAILLDNGYVQTSHVDTYDVCDSTGSVRAHSTIEYNRIYGERQYVQLTSVDIIVSLDPGFSLNSMDIILGQAGADGKRYSAEKTIYNLCYSYSPTWDMVQDDSGAGFTTVGVFFKVNATGRGYRSCLEVNNLVYNKYYLDNGVLYAEEPDLFDILVEGLQRSERYDTKKR